jgi:hypothetical protein
LAKVDETAGMQWLQAHLNYCVQPLHDESWVLDVDATIKPLYGHLEGAVVGYNPRKLGRPSHCYHTYMSSDLRVVLHVEVHPGDQHNPKHAAAGAVVAVGAARARALAALAARRCRMG